jgi:hypothetical protein
MQWAGHKQRREKEICMNKVNWGEGGNWTNKDWHPQGGENEFDANQKYIENLNLYSDPGKKAPGVDNTKEDRYDPTTGLIYSFDEDANHGKGAWAVTGKNLKAGDNIHPGDDGFDWDKDVEWIDDNDEKSYNSMNWGNDFYDSPI